MTTLKSYDVWLAAYCAAISGAATFVVHPELPPEVRECDSRMAVRIADKAVEDFDNKWRDRA